MKVDFYEGKSAVMYIKVVGLFVEYSRYGW